MDKYQPIEFFLNEFQNNDLVTWIVDMATILRAVFELESVSANESSKMKIGDHICFIEPTEEKIKVNSSDAFGSGSKGANASCLHFGDGTAAFFFRRGDQIKCYHFCFEESSDWTQLMEKVSDINKMADEEAEAAEHLQQVMKHLDMDTDEEESVGLQAGVPMPSSHE